MPITGFFDESSYGNHKLSSRDVPMEDRVDFIYYDCDKGGDTNDMEQ